MKKVLGIAVVALLGLSAPSFAQSKVDKAANGVKKGANKTWQGTKKGAKAVGNKTAEVTKKGVARVTDKKSDQWVGPNGQTIYIDDLGKYYWINGNGKKIYVSESALKARHKQ
ncbi:MAG TPA: hypothetical protein VL095_00165 [Flavisolibacter sp.]|jgi:hypothetical protein|nr:hypothetical protein [Flavisolibacter sp.]